MTLSATDKAIWISWSDLPGEGRDAYFTWLHGSYVPRVLDRRGVPWAAHYASEERPVLTDKKEGRARRHPPVQAVPQGCRFMLLVGGEDAHVFADPTPSEFHGGLPAAEREMLGLRLGAATNVMIEQARVDGPEAVARQGDMALSPCIQLGSFVFDGDEDDLLGWYALEVQPTSNATLDSGSDTRFSLMYRVALASGFYSLVRSSADRSACLNQISTPEST